MMLEINNAHDLVDIYIEKYIKEDSICVDGTLGNGYDSLKLLQRINTGFLYAFDIQDIAINNSKALFKKYKINENNYEIIQDSHENIDKYIKSYLDFAILNLGYLPGGNKDIVTKSSSTLEFIYYVLDNLVHGGVLVIVLYPGFEAGRIEKEEIIEQLKTLNQQKYNVLYSTFINQKKNPPEVLFIERRK